MSCDCDNIPAHTVPAALWFAMIDAATSLTNFFIIEGVDHMYYYNIYPRFMQNVPSRVECVGHRSESADAGDRGWRKAVPQRRRCPREHRRTPRFLLALLLATAVRAQTQAAFLTGLLASPDMPRLELMLANRPTEIIARHDGAATITRPVRTWISRRAPRATDRSSFAGCATPRIRRLRRRN